MKIHGATLTRPQIEVVVIPRPTGDIIFQAQPVTEFADFFKLCPAPIPPTLRRKDGAVVQDVEDKQYKLNLDAWATQRTDWMIIKSLQVTEGLEWESVDSSNPDTWKNFRTELETSGLTALEINAVINIVVEACGLNQSKIEEATKRFLAGRAQASNAP
jgi:hypothetical protein